MNHIRPEIDMLLLVSYDIVDDKQRTKLAKRLQNYGQRVQYSVFECDLDQEKLKEMKKQALKFVNKKTDSLRIYKLCESCRKNIDSIGVKRIEHDEEIVVLWINSCANE